MESTTPDTRAVKGIKPQLVRALIAKLHDLQAENAALRIEIAEVARSSGARSEPQTSSRKTTARTQAVRAQLFADLDAGKLTKLGRATLKSRYRVGDSTAAYLQREAVAAGKATRSPSGRVTLAA
ncbi:MAG: hypothetical protein AAF460_16775 [Pseudomonadota bacterium]